MLYAGVDLFRCLLFGAHVSGLKESSAARWAVRDVAKVDVERSNLSIGSSESCRHLNTSFVSSDQRIISGSWFWTVTSSQIEEFAHVDTLGASWFPSFVVVG